MTQAINRGFFTEVAREWGVTRALVPPTARKSRWQMWARWWEAGQPLAAPNVHARGRAPSASEWPICREKCTHVSTLDTRRPHPPIAPRVPRGAPERPRLRPRHPPRSPQPARLPHSPARPLCSARSPEGQAFRSLAGTQTASTPPPPRPPARPAAPAIRPIHVPTSPVADTHRRTGPARPQRHEPGLGSLQRLRQRFAPQGQSQRLILPASRRKAPDGRPAAPLRENTPRGVGPASRGYLRAPGPRVTSCCLRCQAPAPPPCTAQQTPKKAAVRGC